MPVSSSHIWHPFTQMKTAAPPIEIERASGSLLYTADGQTLIDAIASWWVNVHGHCHPAIAAAISKQSQTLEHVIFAGFTHRPAIDLSQKLLGALPANFSRVFFSDDGSTSVEVALKMVIQYWHNKGISQKKKIIAFENAYHGDTFGAMSVAARNAFNAAFTPYLFDVVHLPIPTANNFESLQGEFAQLLEQGDVAAFIFEPLVQGASGMLMYEAAYLDELIGLAKSSNVFCIADEVMTGFGRTGKMFAINYLQNKPDIICLSKGITGGFLPLGVTLCTEEIYDAFLADDKYKTFFHGHSYTANPIACAAAVASFELLNTDICRHQISSINAAHEDFILKIKPHPAIKEIRHLGTILAIEIVTPEKSNWFNGIQHFLYQFYLQRGVYLRPLGNVVYLMPPYCIAQAELEAVYKAVSASLDEIC